MKKILLLILLSLLLVSSAYAASRTITLFTNHTGVEYGDSIWVKGTTVEHWTCDVDVTGTPTAVTILVEGNVSGSGFDPTGMAEHVFTDTQITAQKATFGIANSPTVNIRGRATVFTNGSTITATCGGNPK